MISGNVLLFIDIKISLGLLITAQKMPLYLGKIATSRCQQLQIIANEPAERRREAGEAAAL